MRLLAIDPGSLNAGVAAFEDEKCVAISGIRARGDYRTRLDLMVTRILDFLRALWPDGRVDVLVLETTVFHKSAKAFRDVTWNCAYLCGALDQYLPGLRVILLQPSEWKAAAEVSRRREVALDEARGKAMVMLRLVGIDRVITFDEAVAYWLAVGALAKLREERWEAMAR